MAKIEAMRPIYLPKRQLMESDEDYDTGIVQNEENLNQNLNRLYGAIETLQAQNEALQKQLASLQTGKTGR